MSTNQLKVVGAGLGRTGTESLKMALEQLGFGPCYHMFELLKNPAHLPEWQKLRRGEMPDYGLLFQNYQSCTDFPAAMFYREFMQRYPEAKVVLTVRDADKWYDSAAKTIFRGFPKPLLALGRFVGTFSAATRAQLAVNDFAVDLVHNGFFNGRTHDREQTKAIFNAWNEEVKRTVPAKRLLVFEVKDGWEPLCHFLDVPVPLEPFPRSNESESFDKNLVKRVTRAQNQH